nr:hypothetical protein [Armatimonadota bacterium]
VLACAAAAIACAGTAGITLRLKPKVGGVYRYVTTTTTTGGGQGGSQSSRQTSEQTVTVKNKVAAGYRIHTKITDVKSSGSAPRSSDEQMKKMLKGVTWEVDVTPTGKVSNMTTSATGQTKAIVNAMQSMDIGFMGVVYPPGPVNIGSTWTTALDLSKMFKGLPGGNMLKITSGGKFPVRYKLTGVNAGKATLAFSMAGKTTMSMNSPQAGQQVQKMTMDMKSTGTVKVNLANGLPTLADSVVHMDMNVMGMAMKQKILTSTKMR